MMRAPLSDPPPGPPPDWLGPAVSAVLPETGGMPWHPLPGGRVNRLWLAGGVVIKLYDPAAASPLFPNDPVAEAAALRAYGPLGLAPVLLAEGRGWLAYRHIPGPVWTADPKAVARLLGRLHALPVPSGAAFRAIPSGAQALRRHGLAIADLCSGSLPPPPDADDPGPAPHAAPLHGDAVPGNVVMPPEGPVLIDWQCPATGDPAEDIAAFLSPAMQWLYRGRVLSQAEHDAFLAACPDPAAAARYRALAPLFRWRMAAHCLWKAERGAADYAAAMRLELAGLQR